MPVNSPWQVLVTQLEVILVMLARPVVQREVAIIAIIFGLAWVGSTAAFSWLEKNVQRVQQENERFVLWRHSPIPHSILMAVFGLILSPLAIWLFAYEGYPSGLISATMILYWIWLGYGVTLSALYVFFGAAARPYHRWILIPIFVVLMGTILFANLPALQLLTGSTLFTLFDTDFTLGKIGGALLVFYCFIVTAWILEVGLYKTLLSKNRVDPGLVNTITTVGRYTIIAFGVLAGLYSLGVNASALALIGGGLSVGIGLGLQQIVSNFISGIVLLFERTLQPGDMIDVNGQIGIVQKINVRSSTIRTFDNVEMIVPNETFFTSNVTNFTKTDPTVRVLIPFGVSYNSDPLQVKQLALETVAKHELVLAHPAPLIFFMGFGDSSLDFQLAVWIRDPNFRLGVRSDLYFMLWQVFLENGIEIPFPQRDLNLGRGWEKMPVERMERTVSRPEKSTAETENSPDGR